MRRSYAMTGMSASAASCSTLVSVVPSIEAMIRASAPLVIMFSIWDTCVGMSSSAYCRSTLKPCSSSWLLTALPSAIQRSELLVGIATPMRPPSPVPEPLVPPEEQGASGHDREECFLLHCVSFRVIYLIDIDVKCA